MKKFLLILFLPLFLCACSKQPLSIGYSASLTGTSSELGVSGRNGLMLAIDSINEKGGINGQEIELIVKNDKNDPETALMVDKELHDREINLIIGHMTSSMAKYSLPFINENNMLMISPTMSSQKLSNKDDNFLRVVSSNEVESEFMGSLIRDYFKCKKTAIIYEAKNESYTASIRNYLNKSFQDNDSQIITEIPFESGTNPAYFKIAEKIISSEADSIVILASSFDAALFCQQFYKLNNTLPIFLPTWAMNNDLIIQGGPAVEDVQISSFFDPCSNNQDYLEFKKKYHQSYSEEPSFSSIYSYEAAMILFAAIDSSNSTDPQKIKKTILKTKTYPGLQNEIIFDNFGDATRKIYHYTVKNGHFEKVNS